MKLILKHPHEICSRSIKIYIQTFKCSLYSEKLRNGIIKKYSPLFQKSSTYSMRKQCRIWFIFIQKYIY